MVLSEFKIPYKYGESIKFYTIADWHVGASNCDLQGIKKYVNRITKKDYVVGIGDIFDGILVTDKRYTKSEDSTKSSAILDDQYRIVVGILKGCKGTILGLGIGNHEHTIIKRAGVDLVARLCEELGVVKLGYSGLINLKFSDSGGRGRSVVVHYHHGHGSGATRGADITRYERDKSYIDADIFLRGHTHKLMFDLTTKVGIVGKKIYSKQRCLCVCGTFLRTYSEGEYPSYSEKAGYPPLNLGNLVFYIKPDEWVTMGIV